MITVVGGVYAERCIDQYWDDVYGSGGRAAAALSGLGHDVALQTYRGDELLDGLANLEQVYGISIAGPQVCGSIGFDYIHSLSVPRISRPSPQPVRHPDLAVEGEVVLRFGMLEGSARIAAERAVYDPQSAFAPEAFGANGSTADGLAICCNMFEARTLTGQADAETAAELLLAKEGASVVVIKMGGRGALVMSSAGSAIIPAYRSPAVWKIGSGDVFSAAFTLFWAVERRSPVEAADLASRAVSIYCNTRALPIMSADELNALDLEPAGEAHGCVYLASPMFDLGQRWIVEEARHHLLAMGLKVFSPLHDVGPGPGHIVAPLDLKGIDESNAVLAVLSGSDPGTVFECGYAVAKGIPIVALAQNVKPEDLKMVEGSGCTIVSDFVSAVYNAAWSL